MCNKSFATMYKFSKIDKRFFDENGYIILKKKLDVDLLTDATKKVDEIWKTHKELHPSATSLHMFNFVEQDEIFLQLMALKDTIIRIGQLLGPNIYVFHCHLDVNSPYEAGMPLKKLEWHRDSEIIEKDLNDFNTHMFSVKASFWLSDASQSGRGNMVVIPGSHKEDKLYPPESAIESAVELLVSPGDIVLFDRRIWHARSHNTSNITRKALFYGYSYRWLGSRDTFKRTIDTKNLLWNQLLGYYNNPISRYKPTESELPLKQLLKQVL